MEIREPREAGREASRRVREHVAQRQVHIKGDWHLIVWLCDWEVFHRGKRLGSNLSRSRLDKAARSLDGQKLIRFSMDARGNVCVFAFDLGGELITHRWGGDLQWQLFEPSRKVLTLRGDKKFSYTRSNLPLDAGPWRSVLIGTR